MPLRSVESFLSILLIFCDGDLGRSNGFSLRKCLRENSISPGLQLIMGQLQGFSMLFFHVLFLRSVLNFRVHMFIVLSPFLTLLGVFEFWYFENWQELNHLFKLILRYVLNFHVGPFNVVLHSYIFTLFFFFGL